MKDPFIPISLRSQTIYGSLVETLGPYPRDYTRFYLIYSIILLITWTYVNISRTLFLNISILFEFKKASEDMLFTGFPMFIYHFNNQIKVYYTPHPTLLLTIR